MSNLTKVQRQAERAIQIWSEARDPVLKAAGPFMRKAATSFKESDAEAMLLATEDRKLRKGRDEMRRSFGKEYDKTCACILLHMPYAELPARASRFGTPDDILNSAEKVEWLLLDLAGVDETHPLDGEGEAAPAGEPWAIDLAREFQAHLVPARNDHTRSVALSERLQKVLEDRAEKREFLESRLVHFRRLVGDVYGRTSREYHRLRNRVEVENGDEEAPVTPPPPGPSPAAASAVPATV